MVRVWRVWRRYGRRRSGEGGMDSRDPTHSSGTLAAYETMADQPRRGGPHDPPAASGRRWSPVVVGGPVGPHRWDDFTEDDLEDPLSGVTPQVYSDDFIIDSSDHGGLNPRRTPPAPILPVPTALVSTALIPTATAPMSTAFTLPRPMAMRRPSSRPGGTSRFGRRPAWSW